MKTLFAFLFFSFASATLAHADDYADRARAIAEQQRRDYYQREQDYYNEEISTVRAGVQRFAAKHGGFAKPPEEMAREGHFAFTISFTTADNLACKGWPACGFAKPGEIKVVCIDGNLQKKLYVPKGCAPVE